MYEVYAAAWDSESGTDRSQVFDTKSAALDYYQYLKDNPALMAGSGFDLTLTDLSADRQLELASIAPL